MKTAHIKSSNGGTTEAKVSEFEAKMQLALPPDYRSFLLKHNGGSLVDNSVHNKAEKWIEIRSLYGLCGDENVLFSDLVGIQGCYEDSVPDDFLVIATDWGGNKFLMLLKHPHTIYWWDHESEDMYEVAANFSDLAERIIPTPPEPETAVELLGRTGKTKLDLEKFIEANNSTAEICYEAAKNGNIELLRIANSHGVPTGHVLKFAAINGEFEVFDFLVASGIPINSMMEDNRTALDWASWNEKYVVALRKRGAKLSEEL